MSIIYFYYFVISHEDCMSLSETVMIDDNDFISYIGHFSVLAYMFIDLSRRGNRTLFLT